MGAPTSNGATQRDNPSSYGAVYPSNSSKIRNNYVNSVESLTVGFSGSISFGSCNPSYYDDCIYINGKYYHDSDTAEFPHFGYKHDINNNDIVCLSGLSTSTPPYGTTCYKNNWGTSKQGFAVGYILNEIYSGSASARIKYYFADLLVMYYVRNGSFGHSRYDGTNPTRPRLRNDIVNNDAFKIPGTNKSFKQIINEAKEYANSVPDTALTTISTGSATYNLNFTLRDGYYYSNTITLTETPNINNPKFTFDKNGDKYTFKISESEILSGESESFTATIGSNYYYANRYDCNAGQDVTRAANIDSSITINGIVSPQYCYVNYNTSGSNKYEYKFAFDATDEWTICNDDSEICAECNEIDRCYLDNQGNLVWGKYNNQEGYTLQANKSENECNSVKICDPVAMSNNGDNVAATKCEDTVSKTYQTNISCDGANGKGFYRIDCITTIKPTFDLGDNRSANNSLTLFSGQGFEFGINLEVINKCEGVFDKTVWDNAYKKFNVSASREEDRIKYNNILDKLREKVDNFSNWDFFQREFVPSISLYLKTNPVVGTERMRYEILNEGSGEKIDGNSITLINDITVNNFTYSNENNPLKIHYYLPNVALNKLTGEIAVNDDSVDDGHVNVIDGGNKIYTDLGAKVGEYPINIVISNSGDNKTITNNKCIIKIVEPSSLYRIIDVNNPFVNNVRNVPKNWVNNTRDYSVIIDGNTSAGGTRINEYKNNPLYVFDLSKAELEELKESNKTIGHNYLGTCTAESTDKICTIINK